MKGFKRVWEEFFWVGLGEVFLGFKRVFLDFLGFWGKIIFFGV
jgi:hypothetical protein